MLRVIFDTNIYGLLFKEHDLSQLRRRIVSDNSYIVYGYLPLRKELRDIRKSTDVSRKARNALLILYDNITREHQLAHNDRTMRLARSYYEQYRKEGGIYGWDTSIDVDFMLVACASINSLDVIFSADRKTLVSEPAIAAYNHVNKIEKMKTPSFIGYTAILAQLRNHL